MSPQPSIVILTGAGISKESGLDTFRDAGGIWSRVRIEDVGYLAEDDWFHLAPGRERLVRLTPRSDAASTSPSGIVAPLFGDPVAYGTE